MYIFIFLRKYDNHYEGEFILYKHKTLPYAVSVIVKVPNRITCNILFVIGTCVL